jgi:hypothetical protein
MRFGAWLLIFTLSFLGHTVVLADDEDVEVGEEEPVHTPPQETGSDSHAYDMDGAADDVSADVNTMYFLPSFADKRFPVGKPVTILINFLNNGQEVLNISRVGAFLHSPFDFNYYIQNFSAAEVRGGMVGPKSQMSLDYQFTTDPALEPLEFWMSGYVEYQADGSDTVYRSVFLNETVTLVNTGSSVDFTIILSTLVLLGGFGAGVYALVNATKKGTKAKKKFAAKPMLTEADKEANAKTWEMPAFQRSSGKGPRKMRK